MVIIKMKLSNLLLFSYYYEKFQDKLNNICKWNELPSYDDINFPKTYLLYRLINIKHNCKYLQ